MLTASSTAGFSIPSTSRTSVLLLIDLVGWLRRLYHALADLHVQAEAHHFTHQHIETLRRARLQRAFAFDNALVNPGAPLHIVRFYREHFLERVGRAIRFLRP